MPLTLSTATAAALVEVVEKGYTHSQLNVLFMRLEVDDDVYRDSEGRANKLDRIQPIVETLRLRDEEPNVITLLREVVEQKYKGKVFGPDGKPWDFLERLVAGLRNDGFEISGGKLVATTPDPAALAPQITLLERQLAERGFDVALQHYQQAVRSYADGRLEASNGQLRSFLDDLAQSLCAATGAKAKDAKSAADVLRASHLLDGDEAKLLGGLAGVSNQRGAHAGLTDPQEALFRLHMTRATARYLLARIPVPRKRSTRASKKVVK